MNPTNAKGCKTWHKNTLAFIATTGSHTLFAWTMLSDADEHLPRKTTSIPTSLLAEHPVPISTWMVFNYVPRGYHSSSISSVWQCNSLCPAAMSVKLRQFTCSCRYIALGKSDLPSILCIHLISGTHILTPIIWAVTGAPRKVHSVGCRSPPGVSATPTALMLNEYKPKCPPV